MPDLEPITREEKLWSGENIVPITREEMYIKHIYDKTQKIPSKPITRKEMLLERAGEGGGSDVTIKQLSVTANGTYSEEGTAYSPVIVNVPKTPLPSNAYLLKEIEDVDIATFSDGSNLPMPKLQVGIEPQQDLHGYDSPWVGGSGKNKLPLTLDNIKANNGDAATWSGNSKTINNVTFTILTDSDGNVTGIKANGTASDTTALFIATFNVVSGTQYTLNGCPANGTISTYELMLTIGGIGTGAKEKDYGNGVTYTENETGIRGVQVVIRSGYNAQNLLFYPMIRLASVSDSTFAPYSNICPISGWTEEVITVTDDLQNPTVTHTTTIPFTDGQGQSVEVFGGTLDVVNGGGSAYKEYDSYNGETLVGPWISDRDVYVPNISPTIGAQVVDMGDTTTFYIQPTSIKSLDGDNNVSASTGQIENLEFFTKEE